MKETQITQDTLRVLSHEIKNPLTILLCGLSNLNSGAAGELTQSQSKLLQTMDATCQRLKRIVGHFLDEGLEIEVPVDVAQAFKPFIEGHTVISQKNGIEFETSLHGLENAKVNFLVIEHVLQNLLDNAFRYAKSRVEVKAQCEEGFVHLLVRDDGPGVGATEREAIFKKNYQSPGSRQETGCVGLGLYLCKKLVESGGGSIWVEESHGASFHVRMPLLNLKSCGAPASGGRPYESIQKLYHSQP